MTIRGPFAVVLLLLLFVSLAANFMIAGFLAGRTNAPLAAADVERAVALATKNFPPEIQRVIADTTKANRPQLRVQLQAVQQAEQKMFAAMRAQPLDPATLDAAFTSYRESTAALQKTGQDVLEQAIAQSPPDVRRRIKPPTPAPTPPSQVRLPAT